MNQCKPLAVGVSVAAASMEKEELADAVAVVTVGRCRLTVSNLR